MYSSLTSQTASYKVISLLFICPGCDHCKGVYIHIHCTTIYTKLIQCLPLPSIHINVPTQITDCLSCIIIVQCTLCLNSLIPGQRLIEQMRDGGYQVLVADGSHAPQCACACLRSCDACEPQMQSIYEVWNLREMNTAEENTVIEQVAYCTNQLLGSSCC